jgi:2-polyprenyl-6-hydroxyphenyl methylase/3-demethylubiquinone-9 3-methyltransferase
MQEIWDCSIAPHIWNQYHNQLDTYLAIAGPQPLDILDVGCAQGTLALMLAERGHRVTAVDLRPEFLTYAESRHTDGQIRFLAANVLEEKVPGAYDLVFANQIIEHLVYPDRLLLQLKKKLKPGGRLVVTTPNGEYVKNNLPSYNQLGDPKMWEHMQFTADGDGHFYAYRREELVDIFNNAGLSQVRGSFFESPFISGHMKVRHVHGVLPSGLLKVLDRIIVNLPWLGPRLTHQLLVTGLVEGAA